ncbi:eukaryotic initiation factor 3, gamma subunit protein, partial [Cardiosporidium cionae]
GLRFDYLSLALCYADIRLFRRVMVFDHSMGLLTSAVALKLQGTGKIFRISQVAMSSKIMREAPLSPAMLATIETLPLDLLDSDDPSNTEVFSPSLDGIAAEPPKKRPHKNPKVENSTVVESTNESLSGETFNEDSTNRETPTSSYSERLSTIDDLQTNGVNAFIGVFSSHRYYDKLQELQDLIERCLSIAHRYLQPDGKLVLFCGNMQPLAACQAFLHTTTEYLHIKFEEVFLREHQILPYRSHPIMRGSTRLVEGFLLSAIKVEKHAPRLGKVYQ